MVPMVYNIYRRIILSVGLTDYLSLGIWGIIVQLGSVPVLGAEGCEFKSRYPELFLRCK